MDKLNASDFIRGDTVKIIDGPPTNKGKTGTVIWTNPDTNIVAVNIDIGGYGCEPQWLDRIDNPTTVKYTTPLDGKDKLDFLEHIRVIQGHIMKLQDKLPIKESHVGSRLFDLENATMALLHEYAPPSKQ